MEHDGDGESARWELSEYVTVVSNPVVSLDYS